MSDPDVTPEVAADAPVVDAQTTQPDASTTTAPTTIPAVPHVNELTWQSELDKLDVKDLRRHPKIAGIIGSEAERLFAQRSRSTEEARQREQREATEAELLKFSEENADYIKQHYPKAYQHLTDLQQERARREVDGMRSKTRDELVTAIGASVREMPEWAVATEDDQRTLIDAMVGKTDDQVLPTFVQQIVKILTKHSANAEIERWKAEHLEEVRKAIRQEEAAKLMQQSEAPGIEKPRIASGKVNVAAMTDEEFQRWDEQRLGKKW